MSNKGIGIAFKITSVVLLLGILGVSIGILIVTLNIQDDVTVSTPLEPTLIPTTGTSLVPELTTSIINTPLEPTISPSTGTSKNIPEDPIIDKGDTRYTTFAGVSDLFEQWMNIDVDPCDDFYHYVCGQGQNSLMNSPFTVSQNKDNDIETRMWDQTDEYWEAAPLPLKQVKWILEKYYNDENYTTADMEAQISEMVEQYMDNTPDVIVPFFDPQGTLNMDKTSFSKMAGFAKGQFAAVPLLTTYAYYDVKDPDTEYKFYIDQPLPIFTPDVYTDAAYPFNKDSLVHEVSYGVKRVAGILDIDVDDDIVEEMAGNLVDFDRVLSRTMQQDPTVRREVARNYNPYTLADLNMKAGQFDWVQYIQSALTLLGDEIKVDDQWTSDSVTVANYIFYITISKILDYIPSPSLMTMEARPMDKYRSVLNLDRRTLAGRLRKPSSRPSDKRNHYISLIEDNLPWAATRLYVDTDIPNKEDRKTLKSNIAEIANWIFFGFRSQLDQLNWMDKESKKFAFDKLDNVQLNVAFPDWVTDNAQLSEYYKNLDINEDDNYMNQKLKVANFMQMNEVLPFLGGVTRDRGNFDSWIGVTNAWYNPQMNSITLPEGILQTPFYSPLYPLAVIFGGLGVISGHELTHGFDDQGVQWDGMGALNAWMTPKSQESFDGMAQCVIDQYSNFCPYEDLCLNGVKTQGENIADNGGIQAAYKALKAYEALKGADPRLPGFGSSFTSDQLFFLSFGQTWCDRSRSYNQYKNDIATDVHSPALFRVMGTIQNFPAFRNAFHCPVGKKYTPKEHCDVWISMPF